MLPSLDFVVITDLEALSYFILLHSSSFGFLNASDNWGVSAYPVIDSSQVDDKLLTEVVFPFK